MFLLIGLVVLLPTSGRMVAWGLRRDLPRAWMAWLPLLAPMSWLAGVLATQWILADRFEAIQQLDAEARAAALSETIADGLELTMGGGIVAACVVLGCTVLFSVSPPKQDR